MNDVISLESVRRGRARAQQAGRATGAQARPLSEPAEAEAASESVVEPASDLAVVPGEPDTRALSVEAEPPARRGRVSAAGSVTRQAASTPQAAETPAAPFSRPAASQEPEEYPEPVAFPVVPELSDEERLERISDTVVRALGRRQLSSAETRELLIAQGADDAEAEALVARFEELGYLDDFALAEALVARLSERSHKSRAVIGRELGARKIPSEFVGAALEQLDDEAEFTLALEAATKRAAQLASYDEQTAERRLMGFLTRRGFGSSVVREATRRALAGRRSVSGPRFR